MKINLLLSAIVVFLSTHAAGQTYTEIFKGQWGYGIDDSKPAVEDLDGDGLLDMILGAGDGTLHHFRQEEAGSENFILVSENFSYIDVGTRSTPCFCDPDGDGLLDMIVGERTGNLNHYRQDAAGSLNFTLITDSFNGIAVGDRSVPHFHDLDNDGLLDLLVGEYEGNLNHYRQGSAGSMNFIPVTDNFNSIDVGYDSAPCVADPEGDGLLDLIVGENFGRLYHYRQDATGSLTFSLVSNNFNGIQVDYLSAPCFTDPDGDGLLDLFVGSAGGPLSLYEQNAAGSPNFTQITDNFMNKIDVGFASTPAIIDLDGNGRLDLIVGEELGYLHHYEQQDAGVTTFDLKSKRFNGILVGYGSAPCFADFDGNGLLDMIVGETAGNLNHYRQDGVGSTTFTLVSADFNGIDVGVLSRPIFTDLEGDGLLDMIVGEEEGTLKHYKQSAAGSTVFTLVSENFNGIDIGQVATPCFTDLGNDGLLDMIVGDTNGRLSHYRQDEAGSTDFTLVTDRFHEIDVGMSAAPCFADINGDGLEDLIVGDNVGSLHYFRRDEDTGVSEGRVHINTDRQFKLLPNFPNPFNPSTAIRVYLPNSAHVSIKIYDLLGNEIETLIDGTLTLGHHTFTWAPKDLSGGVYFYRLKAGHFSDIKKAIYLK
jgi:hypothetical protein